MANIGRRGNIGSGSWRKRIENGIALAMQLTWRRNGLWLKAVRSWRICCNGGA
jgi:hypothetical protein